MTKGQYGEPNCINACSGGNPEAIPMLVEALRKCQDALMVADLNPNDKHHDVNMDKMSDARFSASAALAKWEGE